MLVYNDWTGYWQYWWELGEDTVVEANERHSDNCILLIHGYANDTKEVRETYCHIHSQVHDKVHADVRGFHWKSRGKICRYYTDLVTAKHTGSMLDRIVTDLKQEYNYKRVSIMAHSMGCLMMMSALKNNICFYKVHRIALMAGDVLRMRFKSDNSFGKISGKIDSLRNYYSEHDTVLRGVASIIRPGVRIGAHKLPEDHPENYYNEDSNLWSRDKVRHNDYKNLTDLLVDTCNWLVE